MNIKVFSKITGRSAYTIRYYEKTGILQEIDRNASGHRRFSEQDIIWVEFINRLKETGMPLEKFREHQGWGQVFAWLLLSCCSNSSI